MEEIMKDERFSHIFTDPRFRKMPKGVQRVTVDKRFKGMFKDEKFKEKSSVDKRGRPLNLMPSENLKSLYSISSESSDSEDDTQQSTGLEKETNITSNKNKKYQKAEKNNEKLMSKKKKHNDISTTSRFPVQEKELKKQFIHEDQKLTLVEINVNEDDRSLPVSENEAGSDENESTEKLEKTIKKERKSVSNTKLHNKIPSDNYKNSDKTNIVDNIRKDSKRSNKLSNVTNHKQFSSKLGSPKKYTASVSDTEDKSDTSDNSLSAGKKVNNGCFAGGTLESEEDTVISTSESEEDDLEAPHEKSSDDYSDESDDSDSEDYSINKEEFDHQWEELRNEAPDTDQISRRLAVCNMDWDRIRAEDLFAAFASFKPPNGCIYSVKIYPSEFGLKRMEEEKLHGPPELVEETLDPNAEDEDAKESKYHREKLRQYQINRLKYYYAVIDCDSPETSNTLYEQLNGMEYESSSVRFDIRFIPDDVTFDHEPVSVADKAPDPTEYKPRLFVTAALQQVKVNLTWDETDPKRRETLQKAFTEPESIEKDIRDYLASSSSESEIAEEGEEEDASKQCKLTTKERIDKYRTLLQSIEEKEKEEENKYEMEITWEPGLKEKTEEIVKEKVLQESLNPFEELLKKKKEEKKLKKKQKKAMNNRVSESSSSGDSDSKSDSESCTRRLKKKTQDTKKLAELSLMSDSKKSILFDESFNRKGRNKKSKKGENENEKLKTGKWSDFMCNVNDPRFSAVYSSPLFNIDPSSQHFKKTEGNLALIQEKQKRIKRGVLDMKQKKNSKKAKRF